MAEETPSKLDANRLQKIKGHPNYYVSGSGVIYYKHGGVKFSTRIRGSIAQAKRFVEQEIARRSGIDTDTFKRGKSKQSNPSLDDMWIDLMKSQKAGKSKATHATYDKSWRVGIGPFFKSFHVKDISMDLVGRYKLWYLREHKTRHPHHTIVHLKLLFKHCLKLGLIAKLPDTSDLDDLQEITDKFAQRKKAGRVLNMEEQQALIEGAKGRSSVLQKTNGRDNKHRLNHRAYLGVLLALRGGVRKMEGMSLKWENIDLKKKTMNIWSTKNNKWREVGLVPLLEQAMRDQKKYSGSSPYLFPSDSDPEVHISGQVLDKVWAQAKKAAGITGRLRYHDLRHTFATMTAEAGWSPILACDVLDMSLEIYQTVYCKASSESKKTLIMMTFGDKTNGKLPG